MHGDWPRRMNDNRSFMFAHALLLAVVLVGFGRTFYLRGSFVQHALDVPLRVHGTILTCWFALAFAQAFLISTGRRIWHRRVAWLAAAIVPAVVVSAAWINTRLAGGLQSASDPENMFIWGNYMSLMAFVTLVAAGVAARRRADAHRRLLLLASIAIVGPAFARFSFWPIFGFGITGAPLFAIGGMLLMLGFVIAYDLKQSGRVHAATISGLVIIVATLVVGVAMGLSGVGFRLLDGAGRSESRTR